MSADPGYAEVGAIGVLLMLVVFIIIIEIDTCRSNRPATPTAAPTSAPATVPEKAHP